MSDNMRRCQVCNRNWPNRLVHLLFTSFGNIWVDPICALKEMREIHGAPDLEFTGENNKANYAEFEREFHQNKD